MPSPRDPLKCSLDNFGVTKPSLKALAEKAHREHNTFDPQAYWGPAAKARILPAVEAQKRARERVYDFLGAKVKDLNTEAEKSTAGVAELRGVFVVDVPGGSQASQLGLNRGDAIIGVNGQDIADTNDLLSRAKRGGKLRLRVVGATDREIVVSRQ